MTQPGVLLANIPGYSPHPRASQVAGDPCSLAVMENSAERDGGEEKMLVSGQTGGANIASLLRVAALHLGEVSARIAIADARALVGWGEATMMDRTALLALPALPARAPALPP